MTRIRISKRTCRGNALPRLGAGVVTVVLLLLGLPASASAPGRADVGLTMSDIPDPATLGEDVTYTVTVANNGPHTAQDVSVNLPGNIRIENVRASQGTCQNTGCQLGALARGNRATVTFVTRYLTTGTHAVSVSVWPVGQTDPDNTNNYVTGHTSVHYPTQLERDAVGCGGVVSFDFPSASCPFAYTGGALTLNGVAEGVGYANSIYISVYRADTGSYVFSCGYSESSTWWWITSCTTTTVTDPVDLPPVGTPLTCNATLWSTRSWGPSAVMAKPIGTFDCFNGEA